MTFGVQVKTDSQSCSPYACGELSLKAGFLKTLKEKTRPAWAGFKTAEEGRAKICKFLWQQLKNKSNIDNI